MAKCPQYYVQKSHPAIIDPEEFDAVQAEIARRKEISRPNTCGSVFSSKIVCGDCGGYYGPKVWNSNRPNRKIIWRCNDKYKHDPHCQTPHITEEEIRIQFVEVFNRLLGMKEHVIADCRLARETLRDCSSLEREIADLRKEQEKVAEIGSDCDFGTCRRSGGRDQFTSGGIPHESTTHWLSGSFCWRRSVGGGWRSAI